MINDEQLKNLLKNSKTIAVVGASEDSSKPSNRVFNYLKEIGRYKVIPVNPFRKKVLGEKSYDNLIQIKEKVDIVNIFRPSEKVYPIVEESIALKPKAIWMQLGIKNFKSKSLAEKHDIKVIMNRCIMTEHMRLIGQD